MREKVKLLCIVALATAVGAECGPGPGEGPGPVEPEGGVEKEAVLGDPLSFEGGGEEDGEPPKPPEVYVGEWEAKGDKPTKLAAAEKTFEEKNYKQAMEGYQAFAKESPKSFWVPYATFQVARCHYQLSEYDESLDTFEAFLKGKPGLLWEVRAWEKLSSLYTALPSYGYERDGRVYYNYEHHEGEYRYMYQENRDKAVGFLEKARLGYVALLGVEEGKRGASGGDDVALEAVDAVFALAREIDYDYWEKYDSCPPKAAMDPPAKDATYDPKWSAREKLLFLYDEVGRLNAGRADRHPEAWARFKKALFLQRYPECAPGSWEKEVAEKRLAWESGIKEKWEDLKGKPAGETSLEDMLDDLLLPDFVYPRWDPGPELDPLSIVDGILKEHAGDRMEEMYEATRGRILEGRGEYKEAEKVYEAFLKGHPASDWKGDVESSLYGMRRGTLSGDATDQTYAGDEVRLGVYTRNLKTVDIAVHEVDFTGFMLKKKNLNDPYARFTDMWTYFDEYKDAAKLLKKKVWSTKYETKDQGDYRSVSGRVKLPDLPMGTYFIHLSAGKQDVIVPWIKTDLILVGKSLKDEMRYLLTDARSGAPVADYPVTIKEVYERRFKDWEWKYEVKIVEAKTDAGGRLTYRMTLGDDVGYNRVQAMAHEGVRLAATQEYSGPYRYGSESGETYRIFTVTDRPVYRPGDTIKFKHIVRAYEGGKNRLVKGQKVTMQVIDPQGNKILEKTVEASGYGNAWGEVEVPDEAPLGVYQARAYVVGAEWRSYQSSGSTIRVEEYKKPEFEVEVVPSAKLAKAGDEVKARVKATYYFGAPVTGGKVKYKVFRTVFSHSYVPPDRWDWLYGSGFGVVWDQPYSYGEDLVDEGEGVLDDLGEYEVKLPAFEEGSAQDYEYRVTAEVTDLSRRVINGAGNLKVTRDPYYSYVVPTQGFYTAGDKVEVEVLAMTADDEPVPAKGKLTVVKLEYEPGGTEKETAIDEVALDLDSEGRGWHTFEVKTEGQYRARYVSTHDGSKEVTGEALVNAAGASLASKWFRFSDVEVTSKKRTYLRGEEIELFVQSPWPDATIWVTYEGGDEVFHDEVMQPKGMGVVLKVKATEELHPNFFVRATAVRDGLVHTVSREMFIPPGEEILDVTVKGDKDEYKPRSKGKLEVSVRDSKGKAVQGEFSVAAFDESVLYIQAETAGDIRSYYYGERRYNDVMEFHSGQVWLSTFSDDRTKWPEFDVMGLPDTSGYFWEPYWNAGEWFTCPSCVEDGASPWVFTLPEWKKKTAADGNGDGGKGKNGKKGWGAKSVGNIAAQTVATGYAEADEEESSKSDKKKAKGGGGGLGMLKAAESPAPAPPAEPSPATPAGGEGQARGVGEGESAGADVMVREDFRDTALWVPDVVTGKDGKATVEVEWPDTLTTWVVRVFGVDGEARVGLARTQAITTKKLVARVETPRFMVEGDEVTLAAVIHNSYPDAKPVSLKLTLDGGLEAVGPVEAKVTVPAGKDERHDFEVRAVSPGPISVKLVATTEGDSDALVKKLEVMEWGSDKMVARAMAMSAPGKAVLELDLPDERRKDTTELTLALEPTVAGVVLQSMPYLIHYPYGCVEQTMSRFLPAAMVARTLKDLGMSLEEVPKLAEKASLANPVGQAHGDPQEDWYNQPIYDDAELQKIIKMGLKRLYAFQHGDGGWAWWLDGDSDPYMTAYVVSGLWEAKNAGYDVDAWVIDRGMGYLDKKYAKYRKEIEKKVGWENADQGTRHLMAYMAYALSLDKRVKMEDVQGLWDHREALTHYGRSLLALALHRIGEDDEAKLLVENLADVAWVDEDNRTASFKFEAKDWWRWWNNRVETVAWALRAFTEIDPGHEYGAYFARWITNNREGNRWFSTRDTALSVLSLTYYMKAHQEFDPDYDVTVKVNGKKVLGYHQERKNIFSGEGRVVLVGDAVTGKKVKVEVETKGKGALYANMFLRYFTKEEEIEGAGNEILLERHYYLLKEVKKKVKTWHGEVTKVDYERTELEPGDPVKSGDLVEVKIMVESKNDYEYLVFEDYKPAGFEPLELKSGGVFENGAWWNRELRDEKVVNFLADLEQGKQALTYKLRAEIPGTFRVLPHKAYAMYAPRVQAISDSWKIQVTE